MSTYPAILKGTVTGPDACGDMIFQYEDAQRGTRRFPVHPVSVALVVEGQAKTAPAPVSAPAPVVEEVPPILGPGITRKQLCDYLRQNSVSFLSTATTEQLRGIVAEHLKPKAAATK